jgi:hypothetical protein
LLESPVSLRSDKWQVKLEDFRTCLQNLVEDESPPETVFGAIGVAAMDDAAVEVEHVTRLKVAMPEVGSSGSLSSLTLFREDDGGVLMTEDLVVV